MTFAVRETSADTMALSNIAAESRLVGLLLWENSWADLVDEKVSADDFAEAAYGRVFGLALAEIRAGRRATATLIAPMMIDDEGLRDLGGPQHLEGLQELAPGEPMSAGIGYADQIRRLAVQRGVAAALRSAMASATTFGADLESVAADVDQQLSGLLQSTASRPAISVSLAWDQTFKTIEAIGAGEQDRGLKLRRFQAWNDVVGGGMSAGQLILLGARSAMGKTTVGLSVAAGAADAGEGVLFISLEMDVEQLMLRLIADLMFEAGSRATFDDILNGRLSREDYTLARAIRDKLDSWALTIENPDVLNASAIAPMIRRHQREMAAKGKRLGLVVIDYISLIQPPQRRSNREQEVSDIAWALKTTARGARLPIVALAQINRNVESREDKRPVLSDLRDSGALEMHSDTVVFLYREEYYLRQSVPDERDVQKRAAWESDLDAARDMLDIYSAKVRQGATERRKVFFFGNRQAVRDADFLGTSGGLPR